MTDVVMHPSTKIRVEGYLEHSSHALALIGGEGSGKLYLATYIAKKLLGESYLLGDSVHIVQPEKIGITIEAVRKIKEVLRLKKPGHQDIRRVVIVQDIHTMRPEAQNALLKTIEEPPADTVIIVTMRHKDSVLPTILSRITPIEVLSVPLDAIKTVFPDANSTAVLKAHHISGGSIGLFHALIEGSDHPLLASMETAKEIMGESRYQRLKRIETLRNNPEEILNILYCLKKITSYMTHSRSDTSLVGLQRVILHAEEDMLKRVQGRLVLTDLFIQM
jgi:replication-associated recombination protein RarA